MPLKGVVDEVKALLFSIETLHQGDSPAVRADSNHKTLEKGIQNLPRLESPKEFEGNHQ
jgi:hypothetical protein